MRIHVTHHQSPKLFAWDNTLEKGSKTIEAKKAKTAHNNAKHTTKHGIWLVKSEVEKVKSTYISSYEAAGMSARLLYSVDGERR